VGLRTYQHPCTSNNWSHWNSNEKLKEKFGRYTRKTFDIFTTKDSYTWNITHNTKVLQCETWSLSLSGGDHRWFKRNTRKKRPVTRDDDTNNNISVWLEIYAWSKALWVLQEAACYNDTLGGKNSWIQVETTMKHSGM